MIILVTTTNQVRNVARVIQLTDIQCKHKALAVPIAEISGTQLRTIQTDNMRKRYTAMSVTTLIQTKFQQIRTIRLMVIRPIITLMVKTKLIMITHKLNLI